MHLQGKGWIKCGLFFRVLITRIYVFFSSCVEPRLATLSVCLFPVCVCSLICTVSSRSSSLTFLLGLSLIYIYLRVCLLSRFSSLSVSLLPSVLHFHFCSPFLSRLSLSPLRWRQAVSSRPLLAVLLASEMAYLPGSRPSPSHNYAEYLPPEQLLAAETVGRRERERKKYIIILKITLYFEEIVIMKYFFIFLHLNQVVEMVGNSMTQRGDCGLQWQSRFTCHSITLFRPQLKSVFKPFTLSPDLTLPPSPSPPWLPPFSLAFSLLFLSLLSCRPPSSFFPP